MEGEMHHRHDLTTFDPSDGTTAGPAAPKHGPADLLVGCGLAVGGNLLISISLNLQKYTHVREQERGTDRHYMRSPLWWLGLFFMVLGELGNFSAYGFAPASLVAPLGTTTVVANMFIAVLILKERLRPEDLFGCTFAIVGAFLLVNFSQKEEDVVGGEQVMEFLTQTSFIVYVVIETLLLMVLLSLKYKFKIENVLILLLITSILASFTVISAKAVSSMLQLTLAGSMQLQYVVFYVMVIIMAVTAVIQVKYLNQAMKLFDATVVVPTNFVFFTISAIVAGVVFYREFYGMSVLNIFMFLFGCLLCFAGVYFITAGRASAAQPPHKEDEPSQSESSHASHDRSIADILPTWLLTSVNTSQVQPPGEVYEPPHSVQDSDEAPIIQNEVPSATSLSSSNELLSSQSSELGNNKSYGATH